jgi:hypothetical protein
LAEHAYEDPCATACTVCNHLRAVEHSPQAYWSTDATAHWKTCSFCGEALTPAEHAWNEGTVTRAPAVGVSGTRVRSCTVCGRAVSETLDALPAEPPIAESEPAPESETESLPDIPAPTAPAESSEGSFRLSGATVFLISCSVSGLLGGGFFALRIIGKRGGRFRLHRRRF